MKLETENSKNQDDKNEQILESTQSLYNSKKGKIKLGNRDMNIGAPISKNKIPIQNRINPNN